jgi:hypothetical protein
MNTDLAKYRLDMDLHCRFGDIDLSRDAFVRIPFDQTAQDRFLSRRKLWSDPVLWSGRSAVVAATRVSVIAVLTLGIESEWQKCRRENWFAHHHEFERLDEYVAARNVNEIGLGAGPKCCGQFVQPISIGYDSDAPVRVTTSEKLDLFNGGVEIVARMDDEDSSSRFCILPAHKSSARVTELTMPKSAERRNSARPSLRKLFRPMTTVAKERLRIRIKSLLLAARSLQ